MSYNSTPTFSANKFIIVFLFLLFIVQHSYAQVSAERLKNDVLKLTGTSQPRNYKNTAALNEAAAYIQSVFAESTATIEEQKYLVNGNEYKNIIASFGPDDGKRIIIGAHYDVCGNQPGADDNASGVAGLLELSRLFKNQNLKYRIDLVAYTLEEPPFFRTKEMGSYVHAKSMFDNNVKLKGMICLDMIGYYSDIPNSQSFPLGIMKLFYPTTANFITVVDKMACNRFGKKIKRSMKKNCIVKVKSIRAPRFIKGIDYSDHLNYWNFGYKAIMISNTAFYRTKLYHTPGDLPDT